MFIIKYVDSSGQLRGLNGVPAIEVKGHRLVLVGDNIDGIMMAPGSYIDIDNVHTITARLARDRQEILWSSGSGHPLTQEGIGQRITWFTGINSQGEDF